MRWVFRVWLNEVGFPWLLGWLNEVGFPAVDYSRSLCLLWGLLFCVSFGAVVAWFLAGGGVGGFG